MPPKVSAIVSAYFCEPYLAGRLENLLEQEGDHDIIVVCQADSEEKRIASEIQEAAAYRGNPHLISILLTVDIPTVYEAWNFAIGNSAGEYIAVANSDDRHYAGALKALADGLDKHPKSAMAYFNIDRVKEIGGEPVGQFTWLEGGLRELYWNGCFLGPMPMWRRSLHDRYGLFDPEYTVAGDYEFWMRLAAKKEHFFHIPSVLGSHLERPDSLEHRSAVRTAWETARARAAYRAMMEGVNHANHKDAQAGVGPDKLGNRQPREG